MANPFIRYKTLVQRPRVAAVFSTAAALLLPYAYACLCEYVRAGNWQRTVRYIFAHAMPILFGAVVTTLLFGLITVLTRRAWAANLAVGGVLCLASWVSLQKLTFRGDPLLPKDLLAVGAAANIARRMSFTVPRAAWLFLLAVGITTLLLLPVRLPPLRWAVRTGTATGFLAVLALYMGTVIYNGPFLLRYGIFLSRVSFADTYYRGSFVTSFLTQTAELFPMKEPDGYDEQAVNDALALLPPMPAQEQRPCDVFVVLLESYFFLDNYDTAEIAAPLAENFTRLAQEGISGQMLSTGYGGGTANIEFSVLTGYLNTFLPSGSFPYMEYVSDGFLCYPQFLKARGYQTLAVHPYTKTYYNRNVAYPQMGIDRFASEESFSAADKLGDYVAEQATLDKALELYRRAAGQGPVFVHVVTMQNHGPNKPGKYSYDHCVQAVVPGAGYAYNGSLTSIATGLRDIDAAIGAFTDALRESDRDVVVLFFGDHQASVNGYGSQDLLPAMESYAALPAAEQTLRSHVTPYLMWANFDIKEKGVDGGLLPSHMLLPVMLNAYNVVRPAWMDWLLATEPALGDLDYDLYFTAQDELLAKMTDEQRAVYHAQELLQYDLMFGKQYAAQALYGVIL